MKRLNLLLLLFLFTFSATWAQQQKTLVDEPTDLSYYSFDQKIDRGFAPTSNFIQSIIFFSFKAQNKQDYYEVKPAEKFSYYVESDEKGYHSNKAKGATGFIDATDGKKYFIAVDQKGYDEAKAAGKNVMEQKGSSQSYSSKPAFRVETKISNGTSFTISYKDAQSCYVKYNTTEEGNTYAVTEVMEFGKNYTIMDQDFKVVPAADVTLSENTPSFTMTAGAINIPFVLLVLLGGALFFTIYFKFPNITRIRLAFDTVRGKYYDPTGNNVTQEDNPDTIRDESAQGEVSPFQALSAALSATVGLGNIAGVAIAITIGGPGATFWMIIAGLLGMASKFAECTLGVKYREIGPDGTVHGGPMYYLSKGLKEKGFGVLGSFFAVFFAIMCVGGSFGGGNMFQSNQAAAQVLNVMGMQGSSAGGFIFGLITAVLVGVVIIGGIKRIGRVAETIVPFMAVLYVGAALIVIVVNVTALPEAFGLIFTKAFSPEAATGGFIGVMIAGFQRAAFSNEAGVGSAAIAHSAVRTTHPASEGVVALLEPFIDTVVICTMSALVIIITGNYMNPDGLDGVGLTSKAFSTVIPGFEYILTLAVVLFAFSTMLSWSYYGLQAWKYLFGKSKGVDLVYKVMFCVFTVVGASAGLTSVVGFSDAMIFAMVFPNIIGLIILAPVVRKEVARYVKDIKEGRIKAVK